VYRYIGEAVVKTLCVRLLKLMYRTISDYWLTDNNAVISSLIKNTNNNKYFSMCHDSFFSDFGNE